MLIFLYLLLMLSVGRCTDNLIFDSKTVGVGDDVTLSCPRQTSGEITFLFWIRLVSRNLPEVLGGTFNFDYDVVNKTPHITTKQGPGTFLLVINEAKLSDTGVYYCILVDQLNMEILNGTFLRIKGPEPDITAIIQSFPSGPVRPGDSVSLQCSVLSDSEKKTCPGDHSVYWFRAGSDQSHPSLIYNGGNKSDESCEKSPEARSLQRCVYNFTKSRVSSSDTGTYHCAVATCGEILFGNGTKLDIDGLNMMDLQTANTAVFLLCAALGLSLIVIAFLIYTIKKKSRGSPNASVALQTNATPAIGERQIQQTDENVLAYSAPTFTKRKTGKAERRNVTTAEGETLYSDARAIVID